MFSKIGIDWTQRTTKLGAVTLTGAAISLVFICLGQFEKATAVMTLAGTVAGALGFAVKD
ncbi:MAG: hypothetical protein ACXV8Q_00535 [Methylobacter sp.]